MQNEIGAISEWELTGLGLILKDAVEAPHSHHSMTRFKHVSSRTPDSPANTPSTSPYHESMLWGLSKPPWPTHSLWTWDKITSTWLPCVFPSCSHCLFHFVPFFYCAWMKSRSTPMKLNSEAEFVFWDRKGAWMISEELCWWHLVVKIKLYILSTN